MILSTFWPQNTPQGRSREGPALWADDG
jgi:hypothetical protein